MSGRVYERKFDWDEARRLRNEGWTYTAIADRFGVSISAVNRVCNPDRDARMQAASAARQSWVSGHKCRDCGCPVSYNATDTRAGRNHGRCRECAARAAAKVRNGRAHCWRCRTWKPVRDFYPDTSSIGRGVSKICRSCNVEVRSRFPVVRVAHCEGTRQCPDCGREAGYRHVRGCRFVDGVAA